MTQCGNDVMMSTHSWPEHGWHLRLPLCEDTVLWSSCCMAQWPRCMCRSLVSPVVAGVELLPSADTVRPLLFVGNHSRMGVYDLPWILSELYMRGIKVQTTSIALQLITRYPGETACPIIASPLSC